MTITIDKENDRFFLEKLSKLNKKLSKYGEKVEILHSELRVKKTTDEYTGLVRERVYLDIELSEPAVLGKQGVTYVGNISFDKGIRSIFSTDDSVVLGDLPEERLTCDHCGINRFRKKYFVFKDENGELKVIGSSCVTEWFGLDPRQILSVWENFYSISDEYGEYYGNGYGADIPLNFVMAATAHSTMMFEKYWISVAKAEEWSTFDKPVLSTSADISEIYFSVRSPYDNPTKKDFRRFCEDLPKDFYEVQKEKLIATYKNLQPTNDFEWNIVDGLFYVDNNGERVLRDHIKSTGVVGYAIWKSNFVQKERKEKKESNFVGTIGKREVFTLTVKMAKEVESMYGWSTLYIFEDENGNLVKTFYSGSDRYEEGVTYKIKATVKKHDTYKAEKQTMVNRIAFVEEVA